MMKISFFSIELFVIPICTSFSSSDCPKSIFQMKLSRRLLNCYHWNFSLDLPYRILMDGTFAYEALQCKIQIDEQLKSYLETNDIVCSTTLCTIRETEVLGKIAFGVMLILK